MATTTMTTTYVSFLGSPCNDVNQKMRHAATHFFWTFSFLVTIVTAHMCAPLPVASTLELWQDVNSSWAWRFGHTEGITAELKCPTYWSQGGGDMKVWFNGDPVMYTSNRLAAFTRPHVQVTNCHHEKMFVMFKDRSNRISIAKDAKRNFDTVFYFAFNDPYVKTRVVLTNAKSHVVVASVSWSRNNATKGLVWTLHNPNGEVDTRILVALVGQLAYDKRDQHGTRMTEACDEFAGSVAAVMVIVLLFLSICTWFLVRENQSEREEDEE